MNQSKLLDVFKKYDEKLTDDNVLYRNTTYNNKSYKNSIGLNTDDKSGVYKNGYEIFMYKDNIIMKSYTVEIGTIVDDFVVKISKEGKIKYFCINYFALGHSKKIDDDTYKHIIGHLNAIDIDTMKTKVKQIKGDEEELPSEESIEEEDDEEEEDDDDFEWIYGSKTHKYIELVMAGGGSHAWNYHLYENGDVYIRRYGESEEFQRGQMLIYKEDTPEAIKMVNKDYELKDDECHMEYYE